jgi:hypothetical protein
MFKQEVPSIGLSIEKDTDAVPHDGRFHLMLKGDLIYSSAAKSTALARYRELRESLLAEAGFQPVAPDPGEALRRERRFFDLQAVTSESRHQKIAKSQKKGGKGRSSRSHK